MSFRYDTSSETLAVRIINIRNIPKNNKEVNLQKIRKAEKTGKILFLKHIYSLPDIQ